MRDSVAKLILAAALAAVVVGCTASSEPTTTTLSSVTTVVPDDTTTTLDPLLRLALPRDPEVVHGRLDNGLTYYLRENDAPGGRAELRLIVDAGSVQEDPDQAGMAHFLEHMMFNGTERFPRNELIGVLEAFGPRFGPDINAHTSFDETVYELSLSTADESLVQLGVDVLREWATRATLTETDVVEERGVILDEWRLRAQGFSARVNDQLQELILTDSVYEGHLPIGDDESIRTTSPTELERYYRDWYRPDRMVVVAVGDFEVAVMEARIVEAFSDIEPSGEPRPWEPVQFDPPLDPRVAAYVDEEATIAGISVIWPVPVYPTVTVGDYQGSLALSLGMQILSDRLGDDAFRETGPLLRASVVDSAWTRAIGVHGVDAEVRVQSADEGLEKVLTEVERIRRHGIGEAEFQRALTGYSAFSRQIFQQQESAQDTQFVGQISAHHLAGAHLMSPGQRFDIESDIIERLTRQDVEAALTAVVGGAPAVLALGPDDEGVVIPDEERILEVLGGLSTMTLEERDDLGPGQGDLMTAPQPAPIIDTSVHPRFEFTTLRFGNGATVYLWESDIAAEAVFALVEGFGGTSLIEVDDLPEAYLMTDIVGRSGVADIDVPTLRRLLADEIVGVQPYITETRQGLEGNAAASNVETLFQLIHLTMTAPRFDGTAVEAVLDEMRTLNAARADLPNLLFEEAVNESYYGDDPRYFIVPSADQIVSFDVAVAESVFLERFFNAGDFAFAFVGDFDTSEMTDLAARYIGTLPGSTEPSGFVDHQPLPRREVQVTTVEAGQGEQGQVGLFFTNEFEPVLKDRLSARLVELILSARLRERVREELSATYSITAAIDLQRDPDPFAEAFVLSTGDPSGLDQIVAEVLADIAELQDQGPTETQFNTAVEQLRDELELIDNRTLATGLVTAHLYVDQPVAELGDRYPLIDELTPEDVRRMAGIAFNLSQRIEVRQVPRR
jgi:zinc protease